MKVWEVTNTKTPEGTGNYDLLIDNHIRIQNNKAGASLYRAAKIIQAFKECNTKLEYI